MTKHNIDLLKFAEHASEKFITQVAAAGFSLAQQEVTTNYAMLTFIHPERYFIVKADCYPSNCYFNVLLGEGEPEWPDAEWKTIALWKVQQVIASQENACEYKLKHSGEIETVLERAITDFTSYASDFIQGNLSLLQELKKQQVLEAQPFTLIQKDKKGVLQKLFEQQQMAEQLNSQNK